MIDRLRGGVYRLTFEGRVSARQFLIGCYGKNVGTYLYETLTNPLEAGDSWR